MADQTKWVDEDQYWRTNYRTRPYARGVEYDTLSGGYRYGYESANRHRDSEWDDIEPELQRDWDQYPHRGRSTWQQVKDAVRDAWDRVTGVRA
jgi:hypothetical protein